MKSSSQRRSVTTEYWYSRTGKEKQGRSMDFKQIEAFINVVKYKSFSKAADASFLTQPTISAHVSALEKELGVTLIERMGKESRPTKQGRLFYKYALDLLNTREKAVRSVQAKKQELAGILEIQTSSIPGEFIVPELMAKFSGEHPQVRFYLAQSDSNQVLENIDNNEGEIGFAGGFKKNGLTYEPLCRIPCVVIAPKTSRFLALKEAGNSVDIHSLDGESFVWREEGSATRRYFEDTYYKKTGSKPLVVATVNSMGAIKQAVKMGMGVSILPEIAVNAADKEEFAVFSLNDESFDREFYMVYKKNATLSPIAAEFRKFVLDSFRRM